MISYLSLTLPLITRTFDSLLSSLNSRGYFFRHGSSKDGKF